MSTDAQFALIDYKLTLLLTGKDDHEARIRGLERSFWRMAGAATALGSAAGAVAAKLVS